MNLSVSLAGLQLATPIMIASGIWGYGDEYTGLGTLEGVGAVVLKTITLDPCVGNEPACRTVETPSGMLNSIGLENIGAEAFLADKLPHLRDLPERRTATPLRIIVSIAGDTVDEFARLAARLEGEAGIDALEVNISCPNVERGGALFGCDANAAAEVTRAVRSACSLPVIPKLTPNVTDIAVIARACAEAGADALSLINTISGMAIDVRTQRPRLGGDFGGLSGPAIRPAAVLRVYQVAQAVSLPIIGMGGVWDAEDVLEFVEAGATAVGVGTALFFDPQRPRKIVQGLEALLREMGAEDIRPLIGAVRLNRGQQID